MCTHTTPRTREEIKSRGAVNMCFTGRACLRPKEVTCVFLCNLENLPRRADGLTHLMSVLIFFVGCARLLANRCGWLYLSEIVDQALLQGALSSRQSSSKKHSHSFHDSARKKTWCRFCQGQGSSLNPPVRKTPCWRSSGSRSAESKFQRSHRCWERERRWPTHH